jgi:hypothetical protein
MYNLRDLTLLTWFASMVGCGPAWLVRCGSVPRAPAFCEIVWLVRYRAV